MINAPNWKNKKILIAEDEEVNYMFLAEVINRTGATVFWAKNGKEAVDLFKSDTIDLVLMDLKMPEMNGYEALKEIKKINKSIIVIAQTAYAMSGEKEDILNSGFDEYIPKPIRIPVLLSLMAESFSINKSN